MRTSKWGLIRGRRGRLQEIPCINYVPLRPKSLKKLRLTAIERSKRRSRTTAFNSISGATNRQQVTSVLSGYCPGLYGVRQHLLPLEPSFSPTQKTGVVGPRYGG